MAAEPPALGGFRGGRVGIGERNGWRESDGCHWAEIVLWKVREGRHIDILLSASLRYQRGKGLKNRRKGRNVVWTGESRR